MKYIHAGQGVYAFFKDGNAYDDLFYADEKVCEEALKLLRDIAEKHSVTFSFESYDESSLFVPVISNSFGVSFLCTYSGDVYYLYDEKIKELLEGVYKEDFFENNLNEFLKEVNSDARFPWFKDLKWTKPDIITFVTT